MTLSSLVETVGNLPYNSHQIIVFMDGDTKSILDVVANNNTAIWTEAQRVQNIQNIVDALKQHAEQSQRPVTDLLRSAAVQYTSNWISNTIVVLDCPLVLIERILALLSVKKIIYDVIITLDPPQPTADSTSNTATAGGMATIVGGKGVGIAPGAKWMACKACGSSCTLSLLNACAQFMLCPTDTNGNNCNAAKAPHIFRVSPGDSAKAFSVGASDTSDALGSFSSIGPAVNGLVKPDFTGPGVSIRSAWNGNNSDYLSLSGTSMAAPHLAGTIALALELLTCGGMSDTVFPNNEYGYGRINAQNVVNAALAY
ncbi:Peptidase S8, subtilisin-related [Phytophthora cactorum]|nr:Peptidase S8, subtilisin-related [Phytophthora cactorum]